MSTGTATRAGTQTSSYTSMVYDTRKVQADLFSVIHTYKYFGEDYAVKIIADIRTYLDNKTISTIKLTWKESGKNEVIEEIRYNVVSGGLSLADDRPGGIRYNPALVGVDFTVYITHNQHWRNMSEAEKNVVREDLQLSWGVSTTLSYSNGSWQSADKSYSHNGEDGLSRQRFTR